MTDASVDRTAAILDYHEATKHSPESIRRRGHLLDWANKPHPSKVYAGLQRVPLPEEIPSLGVPALETIDTTAVGDPGPGPDLASLARLLVRGAGVHHVVTFPGADVIHFRNYASAGALYAHLVRAAASEPAVARAPLVLVLTGLPSRTAWKYTERGYRHLFWDAGMVFANLLALATSAGFPTRVVLGFADAGVDSLLALESRREFPLVLVPVGASDDEVAPADGPPKGASFEFAPLSRTEYVLRGHLPGERDGSTRVSGGRAPVAGGMDRR